MAARDCYLCPDCGADVPVGSAGCRACGPRKVARRMKEKKRPKKKHSWEQGGAHDGLDLGDDDFDYEDFVAREFGGKPHRQIGIAWYWWLTAVFLLVAMVCLFL